MSLPKLLFLFAVTLFGLIGAAAFFKNGKSVPITDFTEPVEVSLLESHKIAEVSPVIQSKDNRPVISIEEPLPEANRIEEFFNITGPKFSIVETITYKSKVPWLKGRPAWLSDYAAHYSTSRHFIARSLNGKSDYFKQEISEGDKFNVFKTDKKINFRLIIDTSRCKMWFYYHDLDANERVLVKTYQVGLGRVDSSKTSGLLTPLGKYSLGGKIAIYKPKMMGVHNNQKIEMMQVFGSRWIPFEHEIGNCSAPAKGIGIHGVPWLPNEKGEFVQKTESIGKYESDGCVRLATDDVEELFAIIITKPTIVELVRNFKEASFFQEVADASIQKTAMEN